MSLCVAWRYESMFCLASDSCITIGADQRMCGIKVLQIPVRIISAIDSATKKSSTIYQSVFGLIFAGPFLSGYLVKETISELLFNLQYVGLIEALKFEKICETVFVAYQRIINDLNGEHYGHDVDIIMIGACPLFKTNKAAMFFRDCDDGKLKWKPILEEAPFSHHAIGSGENRYYKVFSEQESILQMAHFAVLNSVQQIAESREIKSVGGGLQYGANKANGEFQLFGVFDYIKCGKQIQSVELFRGMDLKKLYKAEGINDLFLHYDFASPFEAKRNRFMAELYPGY
jgi:hypothetical protein